MAEFHNQLLNPHLTFPFGSWSGFSTQKNPFDFGRVCISRKLRKWKGLDLVLFQNYFLGLFMGPEKKIIQKAECIPKEEVNVGVSGLWNSTIQSVIVCVCVCVCVCLCLGHCVCYIRVSTNKETHTTGIQISPHSTKPASLLSLSLSSLFSPKLDPKLDLGCVILWSFGKWSWKQNTLFISSNFLLCF